MIRTKKNLLTILAFFITSQILAQNSNCKYSRNEIDKFTKVKILITKPQRFTKFFDAAAFVYGVAEGEKKSLGVQIVTKKYLANKPSQADLDEAVVVPKGSKIIILLEDESTLELTTDTPYNGSSIFENPRTGGNGSKGYQVITTTAIKYPVNETSSKVLTSKPAKSVRVAVENANYDYDFAKKETGAIQDILKCTE